MCGGQAPLIPNIVGPALVEILKDSFLVVRIGWWLWCVLGHGGEKHLLGVE